MKLVLLLLLVYIPSVAQVSSGTLAAEKVFTTHKLKRTHLHAHKSLALGPELPEGSGLALWNGLLWTHNDSGEAKLFAMDTMSGAIVSEYLLPGIKNNDWEDLNQDKNFFYIGDFGNNSGKRDIVKVLRVEKASLLANKPIIDSILFAWPETMHRGRRQKINFDCEAMAVINDTIFLFTKEWKNERCTRVFSLPLLPGTYTAAYKSTLKTNILITGASYNEDKNRLVLCGYNLLLRPRLLLFEDATPANLFTGKGKKIKVRLPFRQVEGVATDDGTDYYIINEDFKRMFLHSEQQLHKVNLNK